MSDRSLTLLAIHFDDTELQIGPKRIGTSDTADPADADTDGHPDSTAATAPAEDGNTAGPLAVLVAVVLAVLAIAALLGRARSGSTAVDTAVDHDHE
jgi:hypothetical protein